MMKDLTKGNEGKLILQFTIPMLLGQLFQQAYIFVDRIVVGRYLGEEALAAVGSSMAIIFSIISMVVGIAMAGTIIISQYYGAKDMEGLRKSVDTMNVFIFVAGLLISVFGMMFASHMLVWMRVPEKILPMASSFMRWYFAGIIGLFGYNMVAAYLRGVGDSKNPLYFLIIASLLNAVLVFLFIGVFHWGVSSAAMATIISQTFSFLIALVYLKMKDSVVQFRLMKLQFDFGILKKALWIGLPSGLQQTLVAFGMMALQYYINQYGINVIAAYTTVGIIEMFCIMPAMSFSMALITFTGQNLGAGLVDRVKKGLHATQRLSLIFTGIPTILVLIFGGTLMRLFNDNPEVIRVGHEYFLIVAGFYITFAIMFNYNSVLRGAGFTWVPMFITLVSLWLVRIPLAYFFSKIWQENGIFMAIPVSWVLGMIASFVNYKMGRWKKSSILDKPLMD